MAEGRPCWVKCEVWEGMLPGEYGIALGTEHPGGFIAQEYVRVERPPTRPTSVEGTVQGTVFEEDEVNCLVHLPWHESFGQKVVVVSKKDVFPR